MSQPSWFRSISVLSFLFAALANLPSRVHGDGFVGDCNESDFRTVAAEGGRVVFGCDGTITLSQSFVVSGELVLDGTGRRVTISGGSTNRVFSVTPTGSLTLRNITITGGRVTGTDGAAGQNGLPVFGGAILNDGGAVYLINATLTGNSARGGKGGAGQEGGGTLGIDAAKPGGHGGDAYGGAIFNNGFLSITNGTLSGNSVASGSGGNGGNAGRSISGEGADGGAGGFARGAAIFNTERGTIEVYDTLFSTNSVTSAMGGTGGAGGGFLPITGVPGAPGPAEGAAIFNSGGTVTVLNSTFSGNTATAANGANGAGGGSSIERRSDGENGYPASRAAGGAVFSSGSITATNVTFFGNVVVGGNGGTGGTAAATAFGGVGGDGGPGGGGLGGAIFQSSPGSVLLVNASFLRNSARGGNGGTNGLGAGIFGEPGEPGSAGLSSGASLYNENGTVELKNSVLGETLNAPNIGGAVVDGGFNLSADTSFIPANLTSRSGLNVGLLLLRNNGGITPTLLMTSNSPAVNFITDPAGNGAPAFDQRHAERQAPFDAGAVELNGLFFGPELTLRLQTNQLVQLSWSAVDTNFSLEISANLSRPITWTKVTLAPTTASNVNRLNLTSTNRQNYFRLRKK